MAKKQIGRREWLGVKKGGYGYFVKYCPNCNKHIYLYGKEFEGFFTKVKADIPSLIKLQINRLKRSIHLPRLRVEWQAKSIDNLAYDDRVEIHNNFYESNKIDMAYKKFNKEYFDQKHKDKGGLKKLEKMIKRGAYHKDIAAYFGLSKQRIHQIVMAYKENRFTKSPRGITYPQQETKKGLTNILGMIRLR